MVYPRGCKITLAAIVWSLSTVCFQMSPQSFCIGGCIITLVAIVKFFFNMFFLLLPMSLQTACPRGCVITLFTFVWLFSTVFFQMSTQIAGVSCCIITLVTVVPRLRSIWGKIWPCWRFHFSPRCVFRCLLEWPAQVDAYSHWLHLFDLSPVCVFKCVLNELGSN